MNSDRVMGFLCYGNALLCAVLGVVIGHGMYVAPGHIISSQEFVHTTNVALEDGLILGWFAFMTILMVCAGRLLHKRVEWEATVYGT